MLFDLQSPRRKRVVQVVFGLLAVLFAVSFVFLGIGTGISGSPLEAIGIGGADDPAEHSRTRSTTPAGEGRREPRPTRRR